MFGFARRYNRLVLQRRMMRRQWLLMQPSLTKVANEDAAKYAVWAGYGLPIREFSPAAVK
ncbi:hypothetical protein BM1_02207 [Bipolaris maydis]|nr:hypothetical protein BM1_02207 [Bipolaris maydis]